MNNEVTAGRLVDRMMKNTGVPWQSQQANGFADGIHLGSSDTFVTGIVTTFTPTVDVLRRAVATGKNTIICRETPLYSRGERAPLFWRNAPPPPKGLLQKHATAREKQELIDSNHLVIIKLSENWDASKTDAQLRALAMTLGWQEYHLARKGGVDLYRQATNISRCPGRLAIRSGFRARVRRPRFEIEVRDFCSFHNSGGSNGPIRNRT